MKNVIMIIISVAIVCLICDISLSVKQLIFSGAQFIVLAPFKHQSGMELVSGGSFSITLEFDISHRIARSFGPGALNCILSGGSIGLSLGFSTWGTRFFPCRVVAFTSYRNLDRLDGK